MSTQCAQIGIDKLGEDKEKQLHDKYKDWQCNMDLMNLTNKNCIFMHCLPDIYANHAGK